MKVLMETRFAGLTPAARGKVRDIYDLGDKLLIVATDRLSAFDVILPTPIPDKGRVLTQLSLFWFNLLKDVIPNHVLSATDFPPPFNQFMDELAGRSMIVRRTQPLPVECVVRGWLERLSRHRENLRHPAPFRIARIRPLAGTHLYPCHESHLRPRRKHLL